MSSKLLVLLLCLLPLAHAVLVTKHMGKAKPKEMASLSNPGKLYRASNVIPAVLSPVVCVPGVGGNQLFATLNKTGAGPWYCDKHDPSYMIWLALSELLPGPTIDCWKANMQLQYDPLTGRYANASGVNILTSEFGSTLGFEYLDPSVKSETIYFASVVQSLIAVGYQRGINLFGAPYDWRLGPDSNGWFFAQLKKLIEDAYYTNNNTKVSVVAHSMGTLMTLHLLQKMPQSWKNQYIKNFIAISPPWTGAVEAVQALTSGYDFSIPYLEPETARMVQRTFESNYFLMPRPEVWGDTPFVKSPTRTYSSLDYPALFKDLGLTNGVNMWSNTVNMSDPSITPNVDTYCLYGYEVDTHVELTFKGNFDKQPAVTMGDGDGTVPLQSLTYCNNWQGKMQNKLFVKGYAKQEHVALLTCKDMLTDMLDAILT